MWLLRLHATKPITVIQINSEDKAVDEKEALKSFQYPLEAASTRCHALIASLAEMDLYHIDGAGLCSNEKKIFSIGKALEDS